MNHAYVRPGGLAQDLPPGAVEKVRELLQVLPAKFKGIDDLLTGNPIWQSRTQGIAHLDVQGCLALGVTGPFCARPAGLGPAQDRPVLRLRGLRVRRRDRHRRRLLGRFLVRKQELHESLKIIEQALDMLEPGPVMVEDTKIAWPAQLALGSDGMGQSLDHVKKIMGTSMEALIHHFKLVTEGFRSRPARSTRRRVAPRRARLPQPSATAARGPTASTCATRLHQPAGTAAMCEGGMLSDAIAAVASIDPVMGGVDR
jgi:NADH-quinone oxidoreductase subunit D